MIDSTDDEHENDHSAEQTLADKLERALPSRIDTDSQSLERDLFKLILTIIELVRQLMERQALRRVETGDLTDEQTEEIGLTLMRLEEFVRQPSCCSAARLTDKFFHCPSRARKGI